MDDPITSCGIYEFCQLIEYLIFDIQHLETEVVKTRYELSRYLPDQQGELLRGEILSDLGGRYSDHPAYAAYIGLFHDDFDPMDSDEWLHHIIQVAQGNSSNKY